MYKGTMYNVQRVAREWRESGAEKTSLIPGTPSDMP